MAAQTSVLRNRPLLTLMFGHFTVDMYVGLLPVLYPLLTDRFIARPQDGRPRLARLQRHGLHFAALLRLDRRPLRHALHRPRPRLDGGDVLHDRLRAVLPGAARARGGGGHRLRLLSPARRAQRERRHPGCAAQCRDVRLRDGRHAGRRARPDDRRGALLALRRARHGGDVLPRHLQRDLAALRDAHDRHPPPGADAGRGRHARADAASCPCSRSSA